MCGIVITDYTYAGVYNEQEQQRQKKNAIFEFAEERDIYRKFTKLSVVAKTGVERDCDC